MAHPLSPNVADKAPPALGLGYMPFLDGLRGIAIILVLWYHASGPLFRGGFIGVSIFFVLSGFLITGLLVKEHQEHNRLFLIRFYMRRALRLLPPLIVLLIAYIAFFTFAGFEIDKILRDVLIVFFYSANWARAFHTDLPYPLATPLQHTWSLAIEEQFYILWPLLFLVLKSLGLSWRLMSLWAFLGALLSTLLAAVWFAQGVIPMRLYNGLDTACTGLLMGCALAFYMAPATRQTLTKTAATTQSIQPTPSHEPFWTWATIAAIIFLAVVTFTARWDSRFMFYAGYFLVAVASVILIASMCRAPHSPLRKAMEYPWLVKLGRVSYGLYLWHYPIYYLINLYIDHNGIGVRWPIKLVIGGSISLLITILSYRYIETPILALKTKFQAPQTETPSAPPVPLTPTPTT